MKLLVLVTLFAVTFADTCNYDIDTAANALQTTVSDVGNAV